MELVGFIEIKHDVENMALYASVLPTLCFSSLWYGVVLQDLHEMPHKEKQRK